MSRWRNEFADLFRRFENLNLLTLIDRLETDHVAVGEWAETSPMNGYYWHPRIKAVCPLAHGGLAEGGLQFDDKGEVISRSFFFGEEAWRRRYCGVISDFYDWWDEGARPRVHKTYYRQRKRTLLKHLRAIFAERLADADAVQDVCAEPELEEVGA